MQRCPVVIACDVGGSFLGGDGDPRACLDQTGVAGSDGDAMRGSKGAQINSLHMLLDTNIFSSHHLHLGPCRTDGDGQVGQNTIGQVEATLSCLQLTSRLLHARTHCVAGRLRGFVGLELPFIATALGNLLMQPPRCRRCTPLRLHFAKLAGEGSEMCLRSIDICFGLERGTTISVTPVKKSGSSGNLLEQQRHRWGPPPSHAPARETGFWSDAWRRWTAERCSWWGGCGLATQSRPCPST